MTIKKIDDNKIEVTTEHKYTYYKDRLLEEKKMYQQEIAHLQDRIAKLDDLLTNFTNIKE